MNENDARGYTHISVPGGLLSGDCTILVHCRTNANAGARAALSIESNFHEDSLVFMGRNGPAQAYFQYVTSLDQGKFKPISYEDKLAPSNTVWSQLALVWAANKNITFYVNGKECGTEPFQPGTMEVVKKDVQTALRLVLGRAKLKGARVHAWSGEVSICTKEFDW